MTAVPVAFKPINGASPRITLKPSSRGLAAFIVLLTCLKEHRLA